MGEAPKKPRLHFRRHANAGIGHRETHLAIRLGTFHTNAYTTHSGEFHSIIGKVQQDLTQAPRIANHARGQKWINAGR